MAELEAAECTEMGVGRGARGGGVLTRGGGVGIIAVGGKTMSNYEKIEDMIISAGRTAVSATKEIAGAAKNKIDVKTKEYDLKMLYAELGRAYYNDHKNDEPYDYDVMQTILNAEAELKNLKSE